MMYRLIMLNGPDKGRRITVTEDVVSVGRDASCTVVIDDGEAAKRHAEFSHRNDGLLVRDLGTMSKTLVNQREIREAHLKHGDMIEIGRTRFLVQALVEAEVSGDRSARRRKQIRIAVAAAVLVAAIAGTYSLYLADWENAAVPPPEEPEAEAPKTAKAPPVTEQEIRSMREDLEHITKTVRDLAERQSQAVVQDQAAVVAAPAVAEPEDPIRFQVQHWLEDARALIEAGNLDEADALLRRAEIADPEFLPVFVEHAALLEKRGQIKEAIEQWSLVIRQSTETPEYAQALAERARLGVEQEKNIAAEHPVARIGDVRQRRFPGTDDYDEMRIFDVSIAPAAPDVAVDPAALRLEVWFFDAETGTGRVVPTRALAPTGPLTPQAAEGLQDAWTVTATYVVPRGTRGGGKTAESFHGYILRLYYQDTLQDVSAKPQTLADRAPAATDSGQATNHPVEGATTNQPT
jgi:tetratricopeptide (TPR) repeat protein